jgi:hypothetical protein
MKARITRPNVTNVALEVLHIDWVEADNGRVEPDISFCYGWRREEIGCG